MRISDWSSDVCSSDLFPDAVNGSDFPGIAAAAAFHHLGRVDPCGPGGCRHVCCYRRLGVFDAESDKRHGRGAVVPGCLRSEEHTSELQSLMRNSSAVLCLQKK